MISGLTVVWLCLSLSSMALAEGPAPLFTKKPVAVREGDRVRIEFAVDRETDVAVSIEDGAGKITRHLAAGVLGGKALPPEPLKAGLAQSLEWDGRDDFGKPAAGGPFKVRVRAGTTVKFGRFLGEDPYLFGAINSVATDEDGNLYAMGCAGGLNQHHDTLRVFSPEGKYLRTLIPFGADLSPEAAAAAAAWDPRAKAFRPRNRCNLIPAIYPWEAGARIVSASKTGGIVLTAGTSVFRMGLNGGDVKGPFPMWPAASGLNNARGNLPQMAVSADGRYIFYSNVAGTQYDTKKPSEIDPKWPQGRIYRQDTTKAGSAPERFFDLTLPDWEQTKYWMPNAWNCRTAAYHIALDAKGHLHIGDLVNQEIVEVDPDGKKVGATKVQCPERFYLDEGNGGYYVLGRVTPLGNEWSKLKLVKLVGRGTQAKVAAELPLEMTVGRGGVSACLSRVDGAPALWLPAPRGLICVRDKGGAFEIVPTAFKPGAESQLDFNRLAVDYDRDEVYGSDGGGGLWRYEGETGRGLQLRLNGQPFYGVDLGVGYDGSLYVRSGKGFCGPFERFTRDLAPAPLATGSHVLSAFIFSRFGIGICEKGIGVGPRGESYINYMYNGPGAQGNAYFVAGFGADGKPIKGNYLQGRIVPRVKDGENPGTTSAVVGPVPAHSGGIAVDLAGNIYLGFIMRPKDDPPRPGFEKDPAYAAWTGAVYKFPASGGTVLGAQKGDDLPNAEGPRIVATHGMIVVGATAVYPGIAPFSGSGYGSNSSACVCRVPRFDVDRFGRLALPNCVTNSVLFLDNTGNLIAEFGAYGNFDSQYVNPNLESGKVAKPTVAVPEIPLGWPTGTGFGAKHIYVNDVYNRRIVRTDLTWAADETCEIR